MLGDANVMEDHCMLNSQGQVHTFLSNAQEDLGAKLDVLGKDIVEDV